MSHQIMQGLVSFFDRLFEFPSFADIALDVTVYGFLHCRTP